jgi:hypothetical protein
MASNESEFGGTGVQRSGVMPPPHIPNAHEQLMLLYRTGDPSGQTPPDNGEIFAGLREEKVMRQVREAEGVYATKGAYAEELAVQAEAEIAALAAEAAPE